MKKVLAITLSCLPLLAFARGAQRPADSGSQRRPVGESIDSDRRPQTTAESNATCLGYSTTALEKLKKVDTRLLLDEDRLNLEKTQELLNLGVEKAQNEQRHGGSQIYKATSEWVSTGGCEYNRNESTNQARNQAKLACFEHYRNCKEVFAGVIGTSGCSARSTATFEGYDQR